MQNKANLFKAEMNVSSVTIKDYENAIALGLQKNKPNPYSYRGERRGRRAFCYLKTRVGVAASRINNYNLYLLSGLCGLCG